MKIIVKSLFFCCLFFSFSVFADDIKDIQKAYYDWCQSVEKANGKAEVMTKFYADDAILLPTLSSKILVNKNGGLNDYFEHFTEHDIKCHTEKLITEIFGDIGINAGLYDFSFVGLDAEKEKIAARFTFVYKKINGKWMIINHHSSRLPTAS